MKKERLLELAGVQLNEAIAPDKVFTATTITHTYKEIFEELNDSLVDAIGDGEYPEGTTIELTAEIAQKFIDDIGDALWDTAGESMATAHMDILDKHMKAALKKGK